MSTEEIVYRVIDALHIAGVPFMLVGSFSSNFYGIARSTQDADLVVQLGEISPARIADYLGEDFQLDPQMSFETITATHRFILTHRESAFKIELFLLSNDPHDQERFSRRRLEQLSGHQVYIASPEDIVITKLRWSKAGSRRKDIDDVRGVIHVQQNALDWAYIERWCDSHGTRKLLESVREEAATQMPQNGNP